MVPETRYLPVSDRHFDDLPVSEDDDEFLHDNNRIHVTHTDFQRMIDSAMRMYEENTRGDYRTN